MVYFSYYTPTTGEKGPSSDIWRNGNLVAVSRAQGLVIRCHTLTRVYYLPCDGIVQEKPQYGDLIRGIHQLFAQR